MTLLQDQTWPAGFTAQVRAEVTARDTPPGMGLPWCVVCGEPVAGVVHVHHILFRSAGGDGRPSNGLVVHDGCHITRIHGEAGAGWQCSACGRKTPRWAGRCPSCQAWGTVDGEPVTARACGWARSRHSPAPAVYRTPVLCAWRGWIVLLDRPGRDGRLWRTARRQDMSGEGAGCGPRR